MRYELHEPFVLGDDFYCRAAHVDGESPIALLEVLSGAEMFYARFDLGKGILLDSAAGRPIVLGETRRHQLAAAIGDARRPKITEVDLNKTTKHGGAGLEVGPTYVVLVDGRLHRGRFNGQWYGLNFEGIYPSGLQYDPPGTNYSGWQRAWRVDDPKLARRSADAILILCGLDPDVVVARAEAAYAASRRAHAISHHMTHGRQPIDESWPVEAFGYEPRNAPKPLHRCPRCGSADYLDASQSLDCNDCGHSW